MNTPVANIDIARRTLWDMSNGTYPNGTQEGGVKRARSDLDPRLEKIAKQSSHESAPATSVASTSSSPTNKSNAGMHAGLGDIMGHAPAGFAPETDRDFSPLQRIILTANGNLQRLVSSYHNSPVHVKKKYNIKTAPGKYDRQVSLSVFGQEFAVATSTLEITRDDLIQAVERDGVAIGQLFRHFNILPECEIHAVGTEEDGYFWREYTLAGRGLTCRIHERMRGDMFELSRAEPAAVPAVQRTVSEMATGTMGDIMAAATTGMDLPDGFTPLQRMILSANGNIERIVGSYYNAHVTSFVALNHRREHCVFDRQVAMLIFGQQFMSAKSTIYITSPSWQAEHDQRGEPPGALFRRMGEMPTFTLHSVGRAEAYFWRVYSLKATGMTCEITETFSADLFDKWPAPREAAPAGTPSITWSVSM